MIELKNEDYDNLVIEKKRCQDLVKESEPVAAKEVDWIYYSGKVSGINEVLKRLTIY